MNIQTFIFIHDQKIVEDYIKYKKFHSLTNVKYVFLGMREVDKIENLDNVIIARNLKYNIENFPKLTSYTGWYAIWKNGLINSDYINLFEYDINISDNFEEILSKEIKQTESDIFGYIPLNVHDTAFIHVKNWSEKLVYSVMKNYNTNIINFINSLPKEKICSVTSNHTFSKKTFEKYMEWVNPLIDDIKLSPFSGHEVERSISIFYLLNQIPNTIIPNEIHHFQFDSHKTQGINQNKFITQYKNLLSE